MQCTQIHRGRQQTLVIIQLHYIALGTLNLFASGEQKDSKSQVQKMNVETGSITPWGSSDG